MKNLIITFTIVIFVANKYNAQISYLSFGYTSASERNVDIEYFGQHAQTSNNGQALVYSQPRKGFNIGLGMETADVEDGINGYLRLGLNYSYYGGKTFTANKDFRSSMNAIDANLCLGFGQGIGSGEMMVAFYGIVGGTYGFEKLKLSSNYGLSSKYNASRMNVSYGLGLGLINIRGYALCIDALLALPPASDKHVFTSKDQSLPRDYDAYKNSQSAYNGGYVSANWKWFRAEIKLIIPLKKD